MIIASIDGGATWFRMKNNIPWKAMVRDIQIHPVTNDLILASTWSWNYDPWIT